MWVYGSSWCNETGCVVRRAVRYQRVDKKGVPIYHKSHFADDSGNFLLSFYQVVFKLRCAKTQKCENCQQKENPSPRQIRRFPVSPGGEGPCNSLAPSPFIPLPQIDCQHILGNFYDIHDAAEKWQRYPRRFGGAEYNISPTTEETCNRRLQRRSNRPQTQLRDMLTGLFNTKRRLFSPPETAEAFLELQSPPLWQPLRCGR